MFASWFHLGQTPISIANGWQIKRSNWIISYFAWHLSWISLKTCTQFHAQVTSEFKIYHSKVGWVGWRFIIIIARLILDLYVGKGVCKWCSLNGWVGWMFITRNNQPLASEDTDKLYNVVISPAMKRVNGCSWLFLIRQGMCIRHDEQRQVIVQ